MLAKGLLCSRHSSKWFLCIILLNPDNDPMIINNYYPYFTNKRSRTSNACVLGWGVRWGPSSEWALVWYFKMVVSPGDSFAPTLQGSLKMSGDIFLVTLRSRGYSGKKLGMLLNILWWYGQPLTPTAKNHPDQNVSGAKVENASNN